MLFAHTPDHLGKFWGPSDRDRGELGVGARDGTGTRELVNVYFADQAAVRTSLLLSGCSVQPSATKSSRPVSQN